MLVSLKPMLTEQTRVPDEILKTGIGGGSDQSGLRLLPIQQYGGALLISLIQAGEHGIAVCQGRASTTAISNGSVQAVAARDF